MRRGTVLPLGREARLLQEVLLQGEHAVHPLLVGEVCLLMAPCLLGDTVQPLIVV